MTNMKELGERFDQLVVKREDLMVALSETEKELEAVNAQIDLQRGAAPRASGGQPRTQIGGKALDARILTLLPTDPTAAITTQDLAATLQADLDTLRRRLGGLKEHKVVDSRLLGPSGRTGAVWWKVAPTPADDEKRTGADESTESEQPTVVATTTPPPTTSPPVSSSAESTVRKPSGRNMRTGASAR